LGACTLISRRAMLMGVSFSEIYNLGFIGEDRHFCIRAAALGLELYADTHYPPYHIYRESDLAGLAAYKEHFFRRQPAPGQDQHPFLPTYGELFLAGGGKNNGHIPPVTEIAPCPSPSGGRTFPERYCSPVRDGGVRITAFSTSSDCYKPETKDPGPAAGIRATPAPLPSGCPANGANTAGLRNGTITLAMLVRNETGRYLERVLKHASQYIQQAVILDDASEDGSPEVCRRVLENVPLTLVCNREPSFNNEILLRKQLWELAAATDPDWVLILDADEIFEERAVEELPLLAANPEVEVYYFRLYDMWDENHYRDDDYWRAHLIYRPFMVRYIPGFPWQWQETPQHCGRFPRNVVELKGAKSSLRIKHLGWIRPADRLAKYYRYKQLDPRGHYGIRQQYLSILDPKPNLVPWVEN
ncbi:glycosyltransferase family 2 protein, partial [Desulfofundulus thermobenzoicus]